MELACHEWHAKLAAEKTWTNLKSNMKAAHLDIGLTMMADTGGYGANNAEEQATEDATQAYFTNMIDQQTMTTATITTIMETMKQRTKSRIWKQRQNQQAAKIPSLSLVKKPLQPVKPIENEQQR